MSTTDYKRPLIVGIFILLGLLIIVTGVFTVGSQQKLFKKKFSLNVVFDDVSGLQEGNNIWLSGVKIGTVKKISFDSSTHVKVIMNIDYQARTHITKNAKAKISTDGFLGNKIIVIFGGAQDAGIVSEGDMLISEKSPDMDDMLATLQESNKNLQHITSDFKIISERIAQGRGLVGELINDPAMTRDFRSALLSIRQASLKGKEAVENFDRFSDRMNDQKGLVNQLITDTVVFRNLEQTVKELNQAASGASTIMDTLKEATRGLNQRNNPAGMILHDESVAGNLRQLIVNLDSASKKLDEDLEALQHNFLLRGYFKSKAKGKTK